MKRALITGITGQDGSYLAELLLDKGYEVHGIVRRSSSFNTERIDHLYHDPHEAGRAPVPALRRPGRRGRAWCGCSTRSQPDEIYHLGAQSHVRVSFDIPEYTADVTGLGTLRLLEAIREPGVRDRASTRPRRSEMFGATPPPQNEATPFHPRSPYARGQGRRVLDRPSTTARPTGCSPSTGSSSTTSPRAAARPSSRARSPARVARIKAGLQDKLYLGNLDAKRDWGYAPDYVEAMWRMLQARRARRLRDRHRRDALGARVPRRAPFAHARTSTGRRTSRSTRATSARRGRRAAAATPSKAREKLGWEPTVTLRGARADHGRRRRAGARGRSSPGKVARVTSREREPDPGVLGGQGGRRHRRRRLPRQRRRARLLEELGADVRVVALGRARPARPARRARGASTAPRSSSTWPRNVGGIGFNRRNPAPLVYDNMMMGLNVFEQSRAGRRRASSSRPARSAPTRSSRPVAVLARTTSGTATRRSRTRPTASRRRCCSCSPTPTGASTASTPARRSSPTSTAPTTTSTSRTRT